jgi:1-acyl-sn-glycerol-3-phosphate acyltransferase
LLFLLLKIPARVALWFYCKLLYINKKELLQCGGPLLIAANHPNSFLDAVILDTLFAKPVYSLARGDVFVNNFYAKILRSLKILPIYRISEGIENLEHNYSTFDECKKLFKNDAVILVFSEGKCVNEWHLRPLKKGTARLAISCWQGDIPLKVLPLGINYNSFRSFGKIIKLNFGEMICKEDIDTNETYGKSISSFNNKLQMQLKQLVIEIDKEDKVAIKKEFAYRIPAFKKVILFIPSLLGWLLHAPFYYPIKKIAWQSNTHKDHFDSILIGFLFVAYPFYLLLIALIVCLLIGGHWWLSVFILLPFFAWSCIQLKEQQ